MARLFPYSIFALLLASQLQLSNSEPFSLIALAVVSSLTTITDFISNKVDRIIEVQSGVVDKVSIYHIGDDLKVMTQEIIKAINDANKVQTLKVRLHEVSHAINNIDEWFDDMVYYNATFFRTASNNLITNDIIILEAEDKLVNALSGPMHYLNKIYKAIFSTDSENIFQIIGSIKQDYSGTCINSAELETEAQIYQKLYAWSSIAAAKTFMIMSMAAEILHSYRNDDKNIIEYVQNILLQKDKEVTEILKSHLKNASKVIWRCDPEKQVKGVTFIELEGLFQKFLAHEHDFQKPTDLYVCGETCEGYGNPKKVETCTPEYGYPAANWVMDLRAPLCNNQRKCSALWNCGKFPIDVRNIFYKDDYMTICNSDKTSGRRYDYIERRYGSEGKVTGQWGKEKNCKAITTNAKAHSIRGYDCDICICTCEDDGTNSVAYINLEAVYSDYQNNRIVTGARLVKKHNAIHIEIQQGKLGKRGTIIKNSASWVTRKYSKATDNSSLYHKLTWNTGRTIRLTDFYAMDGDVIVGLKFSLFKGSIELTIETMTFEYNTGKLIGSLLSIHSQDTIFTFNNEELANNSRNGSHLNNANVITKYVDLSNRDVPTLSTAKSSKIETSKYLNITTTGLEEDIGQTTIPFWDIQEVTTTIRTPMSGAGLYYKTYDKYGGFIGLRLFAYDLEPHIKYREKQILRR